jgi:hypothetical protein
MAVEFTETFEQILKDTAPNFPGAVRELTARELRLAAREFFEKSYAWTKVVTGINAPSGETPTQINDGDVESEVIGILYMTFNGSALLPIAERPPRVIASDLPLYWYVTSNPDEFCLYPYLSVAVAGAISAKVALIPAFNSASLPRQVTLKFYDSIVDGFLARMYMQPNKPYSNAELGAAHRQKFVQSIGFYAGQRKQGFNNSPNWRFPAGWSPRRVG